MDDIILEQAIYGSQPPGGYRFLGRSSGFLDEWLPEAERLCTSFGDRPANVLCPEAVFAQPFGKKHVAVVQVADQGVDDAGRPGVLGFRVLLLTRADYAKLAGDPFHIAAALPPDWRGRELLPTLTLPAEPPPRRTVAQVQAALQRPVGPILIADSEVRQGGSHVLLGGAQALLDGARLLIVRPAPDPALIRDLWLMLPTRNRCELWPATFAFDTRLGFDAVVVPASRSPLAPGDAARPKSSQRYVTEEQVADYPEGRYELALQSAAESGDQAALDSLFARRTRGETLRLVVVMFAIVVVAAFVINWLPLGIDGGPNPQNPPPTNPGGFQPTLPPPEKCAQVSAQQREELTASLKTLADELQVPPPDDPTAEAYLLAIDQKLGTPNPAKKLGALGDYGPVRCQLQALAWKHGVEEYADPTRSPAELVDLLRKKLKEK